MANSLIEQLRALLLEAKERSSGRHQAFTECQDGFARRLDILEKSWQLTRQQLEEGQAQRQHDLQQENDQTLQNINGHHDEEHVRLTDEYAANRAGIEELYATEKGTAQTEFKETQWTILTLNESDKRVARDQLMRGNHKLKESRSELKSTYLQARKLIRSWKFARNLHVHLNYQPKLKPTDPWKNLEQRRDVIVDCRQRLQGLKLPRFIEGRLLLLICAFAWLALVPLVVLMTGSHRWLLVISALAISVAVPLAGWLTRLWMTRTARLQIALLWQGLAQAFIEAKPLRHLCLQQARKAYKTQRKQSRALYRLKLQKTVDKYRRRKRVLKSQLSRQLAQVEQDYQVAIALVAQQRDDDLRITHENFTAAHQELTAACEQETRTAEDRHARLVEENDARHVREWQKLVVDWQEACQRCDAAMQSIHAVCERDFPSWGTLGDSVAAAAWQPPAHLPDGLPMGNLAVSPELIPHGEPEDPQLPKLSVVGATLPALLPFPEKASVLFRAVERGRDVAVRALEAMLLRAWTCVPPGKLRCTIIDPVGRGENFAAFMHLADQDESLITSRIWTETSHIDQRLTDLTSHMETVLQKFLRNRYETLAEYNAQAGEVAEPFRLLVVAHFPVNFSSDAARRLISLASAGARCGIYTLVMVDAKQPMPHGVELADLEAVCMNLVWREGQFRWREPVFGEFPLTLAALPAPEVCTSILTEVGAQAKRANRVEVPFESIAPPAEDLWTADSRAGIAVPLGRAGANAFQLLSLGKGTSQHALIAGKTGSGKSTLLHVLILQLALRYSPDEVELYLIDFKKGVEFKTYASHHLPHARVVAVESEREFGLSVLQRLDAELIQRGELFRQLGVNDLAGYRNLRPKEGNGEPSSVSGRAVQSATHNPAPYGARSADAALPRVMLIVDEFQEFFVEDDKIAQETALLLDRLVRQGRAFGIHIILGSQTLGGAYSLARSTIDQMAVRIALQCSESDAHLILSKENSEARLLSRPGEAIYNAANGLLEGNNLFQIVWLTDQRRDDYLAITEELARKRGLPLPAQVVFEGSAPSDLAKNPCLLRMRAGHKDKFPGIPCWLGESVAIKDPTAAFFRRQSGANLLMAGQNSETAFSLMVSSLVSLAAQPSRAHAAQASAAGAEGSPWPTCHPLVMGTALEAESEALLNKLAEVLPVRLVPQRELPELLAGLSEEMQRRQREGGGDATFLFLHGLQRLRDLRRADDDFSYGRRGEDKPSPSKLFLNLLREGPPLGIFTILWCDTMTNLQRSIDRQALREFEMRVLFSMNAADSSNLMDSPLASKLGPHRALFYSEDQGKTEKFRPYGLPTLEWLRKGSQYQPEA